jgi:pimeloyl-ACP methyl ester carboxylesterase/DNA-binding winged helix-turn-helix (wHTH) protein
MAAVGREDFAGNLICSLDCPDYSVRAGGYPDAGQAVQFVFGDYSLDVGRRELRRGQNLVQLEPQVFDLLVYLVRNRDRVVTRDDIFAAVWGGRIVSESTLSSRITAVRKAIGDSGEQQALIRTAARKGIRFIGEVSEQTEGPAQPIAAPAATATSRLRQEVHFCTASDGVRIAYAEVGHGPPLIKAGNWLNHLEYDWESPIWSPFLHTLAAEHRLIRYDARGNGLSDWEVKDLSLEAFVRDLESVVEATGLDRFPLLGMSQGCAVSIAYAVRHPERVSHLVLYGGFARGRRKRGSQQDIAGGDAIVTLIRQGWGQDNPAFRQMLTSLFMPGATPEQMQSFNDMQRITTSPENAARLRQSVDEIDVTDLLASVNIPTLVLHARNDAMQPFDEGRRLAMGIRGARFVALESRNHMILQNDPVWSRFFDEIENFLKT